MSLSETAVEYKGVVLSKNSRAYELFKKKELKLLDAHLKEVDAKQKQHLARYYKLPEEQALFDQALVFYGLK